MSKLISYFTILLIFFLIIPASLALENNTDLDSEIVSSARDKNTPTIENSDYQNTIDDNGDKSPLKESELNDNLDSGDNLSVGDILNNNDDYSFDYPNKEDDIIISNAQIKENDNSLKSAAADTMLVNSEFENNNISTNFYSSEISYTIDYSTGLPSKYDLRDYGYVTSVKNQGTGGYCWAFTALSVLESCILKSTGITYDFSENNLINYIKGSKYGLKDMYEGGSIMDALAYLLSWMGPVSERNDPYMTTTTFTKLSNLFHVQDVLFIDLKNRLDLTPIKEAIIKYGAVGTSMYWDEYLKYLKGSSYYNYEVTNTNHAITIVGWDDNYSRYNFDKIPEGDGAWIVKNSFGTNFGDGGYFYISYYDKSMNPNDDAKIYTFILDDTTKYDKNYQYDYAGATRKYSYYTDSIWTKNVYTSTRNENLAAVSTYFLQEVKWELYIYVNGKLKYTQSSTSKPGYYTIKLNKMIPLQSNDKFSIVYHLKTLDGSDITIPVCSSEDTINKYFSSKKSFISMTGTGWYDTYNQNYVNCIKAFTIKRVDNAKDDPNMGHFLGAHNIVMYYGANVYYKVKVKNSNGKIAKGVKVKIKIGKTTKTVVTDSKGYAKLKIKLKPGKYKIKITYKSYSKTTKLTVKSTIITKNIHVKKGKTTKFKAKILNTKGKILKGKKVKFIFKGKIYKVKTNKKGIATLKINRNLKIGRYKVKTSYSGLTISNRIAVK